MATTFNVIHLGNFADLDTTEGNTISENASALVGVTVGSPGDALSARIQELTPGTTGFSGGGSTVYDIDNTVSSDTFSIDGGPDQTFDGGALYSATITFADGSTATVTAAVFQDDAGETYLAPEISANADQTLFDSQAIQSITLDTLLANSFSGMTADRQVGFVPCFTKGTLIQTPSGLRPVESLKPGDCLCTRDQGPQPIQWIGHSRVRAEGKLTPISIPAGALGAGLPERELIVSPQHRMLLKSRIAKKMFGSSEVLVAAKKLLDLPGISLSRSKEWVDYFHVLLPQHSVIYAEGAETESLYLGKMTLQALDSDALEEIKTLFPEAFANPTPSARLIPTPRQAKQLIYRHMKNAKPLVMESADLAYN